MRKESRCTGIRIWVVGRLYRWKKNDAKTKERGVYKGRKPSVDVEQVEELKASGMGALAIAKAMGIGRASVYRALGS